ncbi:MAG: tRNA (guanosine(46)-N7)-methyltransferase TrmB [Lachnospiraceae bacterium]|nr:tRNA (guanosine(46)-N7)-methyltransferase TrmB [Lachnospiraceae bacterium]
MRLKNIPGSRETIAASELVIHEPEKLKGKWSEEFGRKAPLAIEIGMGKGRFLMGMAEQNPDTDFIGIEKYSSVLLRAIQKLEAKPRDNVRLVRMDAEYITDVFAPGEVDIIYLNFSDPWPKDRHAKRRLPSRQFLARYDSFLKPGGRIEFKTDNRELFDFAVEEVNESVFEIKAISYDLHADSVMSEGNIMTEYEEKFSGLGNPIYKYILERKKA